MQLVGNYTVTINTDPTINSLTVSDPNATVTDSGHTLTLNGGGGVLTTINSGATFNGSGTISGDVVNDGTIDASVSGSTLQIDTGNITGSGSLKIESGATLEVGPGDGSAAANGAIANTITFASSTGTLQLSPGDDSFEHWRNGGKSRSRYHIGLCGRRQLHAVGE